MNTTDNSERGFQRLIVQKLVKNEQYIQLTVVRQLRAHVREIKLDRLAGASACRLIR